MATEDTRIVLRNGQDGSRTTVRTSVPLPHCGQTDCPVP